MKWQDVIDAILWMLSCIMMLGLFTAGSWLPPLLKQAGFSA